MTPALLWWVDAAKIQHGGRYDCSLEAMGMQANRARIEAKNYLPAVTPAYRGNEGDQTFDVRLKKGQWLEGVVRGLDGVPLAGAEVILVAGGVLYVADGIVPQHDYHPHLLTGPNGLFSFSPPEVPFRLVALHERGYAEATARQLAELRGLNIEPWGRIEGTLRVGGRLQPHETVSATLNDGPIDPEKLRIRHWSHDETDEQGHFVFDRVVPGEARVSRGRSMPDRYYQPVFADVMPGQTARVDLIEEGGRPLVGRVVAIDERGRRLDLAGTSALLSVKVPDVPYPPGVAPQDRPKWLNEWSRTPAAATYRHSRRNYSHSLKLQSDGAFRIDEVQRGAYTLHVHVKGFTTLMCDVNVAAAVGERREAIDVGTLTLKRP